MKSENSKAINDKDLDIILESYAKKHSGKHGTDEEMFADLKAHFAEEKANKKKAAQSSSKGIRPKRALLASGTLCIAAILTLSLVWYYVWNSGSGNTSFEDLSFSLASMSEIESTFGENAIIPIQEDFEMSRFRIARHQNTLAGYDIIYESEHSRIIFTVVVLDNCLMAVESNFISTIFVNYNGISVEKQESIGGVSYFRYNTGEKKAIGVFENCNDGIIEVFLTNATKQ